MTIDKQKAYLIVNADDFGYYRCVSEGIVQAHLRGVLTATAILANLPRIEQDLILLKDTPELDLGVHLNLTVGMPLSPVLRRKFSGRGGRFPSKMKLVGAVLKGSISEKDVEEEWRLQINRCLDAGVEVQFLNSHEHMHMLPTLFPIAQRLAKSFSVDFVRIPSPGRLNWTSLRSILRDVPLKLLCRRAARYAEGVDIGFLGLEASGKMTKDFLDLWIPRLEKGRIYELMCHPGFFDPDEITEHTLLAYHDWQTELDVLTDPATSSLLESHDVIKIRYRDIAKVTEKSLSA